MGKIIALHSYKGGTGKTLISVNLAATYARKGKDVCLLDLDFRAPSLHVIFRVDGAEYWLNDYLSGVCGIEKVLIDVTPKNPGKGKFLVGLANPTTEAIREMSAKDRKWEMRALGRLLSLKNSVLNDMHMDYIIFDTSPGLQYSSINAIVGADTVLVITGTDTSDIEGTQRMIHELYDLFEKKTAIIMNKVPCEVLPSKNQKRILRERYNINHTMPLMEVIPCSCDILRAGGTYIFSEEKPDHPFSKTLAKIASYIEAN